MDRHFHDFMTIYLRGITVDFVTMLKFFILKFCNFF